jgi:hypothetical protein
LDFGFVISALLFLGPPFVVYALIWRNLRERFTVSLSELVVTVLLVGGAFIGGLILYEGSDMPMRVLYPLLFALHLFASTCITRMVLKGNSYIRSPHIVWVVGIVLAILLFFACTVVTGIVEGATGYFKD